MSPADGRGAVVPERIRECLEAVLQQTQAAGPAVSHVTLPIAVADDVARVLEGAARQPAPDGGALHTLHRVLAPRFSRLLAIARRLRSENDRLREWSHLQGMDIITLGQQFAAAERERDAARRQNGDLLSTNVRFEARAREAERERDAARAENDRLRQGKDRFKAGVRSTITWLHARGYTMKDAHAKAVLDCAADRLGSAMAWHDKHPTGAAAEGSPVGLWRQAVRVESAAQLGPSGRAEATSDPVCQVWETDCVASGGTTPRSEGGHG